MLLPMPRVFPFGYMMGWRCGGRAAAPASELHGLHPFLLAAFLTSQQRIGDELPEGLYLSAPDLNGIDIFIGEAGADFFPQAVVRNEFHEFDELIDGRFKNLGGLFF